MFQILERDASLKEELMSDIYEESSSYILEGLEYGKLLLNSNPNAELNYNNFSRLMKNCSYAADLVEIRAALEFNAILEKFTSTIKADDLNEQFEPTVIPALKKFMKKLESDSKYTPENVRNCVQSYTTLVPLFQYSDSFLGEDYLQMEIEMINIAHIRQTWITEINDEAISYIYDGWLQFERFRDYHPDSAKIYTELGKECAKSADATLNSVKLIFNEIFKEKDSIRAVIVHAIEKVKSGGELDDFSDLFKSQTSIIFSELEQAFKLLEQYKISVPLETSRCIDELLATVKS